MHIIIFTPQIFVGVPLVLHPNAHHVGAMPVPMENGCCRIMVAPEPTLEAHTLGIANWIPSTDPMPDDAILLGPAAKHEPAAIGSEIVHTDGLIIWRPAARRGALDARPTPG